MKKRLSIDNLIFYGLLFLLSLFYAAYQEGIHFGILYGHRNREYYEFDVQCLVLPAIWLILLLVSVHFLLEREFKKTIAYWVMGLSTLALALLILISRLVIHAQGRLGTFTPVLDVYIYPIGVMLISILILINYIRCAVETSREDKQFGPQ